MTWFKVDDKLHEHRKAHKAGPAAMGLWVLAGSWSSDNGEGGFVPERVLSRWATKREAARLVEVGLWAPHEKEGERGWIFHEWDERNPDEGTVRAIQDAEKEGASLGNHRRWHVKRGVTSKDCPHCQPSPYPSGSDSGTRIDPESSRPEPDPNPTRPVSVVTSSSPSSQQREVHEDGLLTIALATGGDLAHARKVVAHVLSTSGAEPVRNPLRYVLAAVRENPDAHRYRRGNPTKDTACPEHPGEWADRCRIHASERGTA